MMASDTVPAAVPGPGDQAGATPNGSTQPAQPGGLASLFAAVDPARAADPSFSLNPTTAGLDDTHTEGGSSAAFHGEDTKDTGSGNGSGNSGSTRQERSVMRAWLLAGAERWKKGGDARLERLRISKAKANAFQVKETRTVAVNRAGGGLFNGSSNRSGGGSGAGGGGKSNNSKGLGGKSGGGHGPKGPSNKSGASGNGSAGGKGSGGGGGRGPAGGSGGQPSAGPRGPKHTPKNGNGSGKGHGGDAGGTTKQDKTKDPKTPSPKNDPGSKSSTDKDGKSGPAGSGKTGPQGPAGTTGKHTPAPGGSKDHTPKNGGPKSDHKKTPDPDKVSLDKTSKTKKSDTPKTPDPKTADPKSTPKGADQAVDPRHKPAPAPGTGQGKTLNIQDSRETGYRDGTRTAKTVAHVRAYRDGFKDGHRDTTAAAEREKARLDKAHEQRKQEREKDVPVTGASSADYHPKPDPKAAPQQDSTQPQATPVQVKHIDATHLQLGDGAARTHISRGEVRTLRNFQNRLTAKTDVMTRVAEATRALKVHAEEQAKQVTTLLEQAKAVEGGNSLVAALTKLEDNAKTQAGKAEEIHKRALRAAEAAKTVVVNSETRYGDIYKAVADSPETRPAKMTYYQETANA